MRDVQESQNEEVRVPQANDRRFADDYQLMELHWKLFRTHTELQEWQTQGLARLANAKYQIRAESQMAWQTKVIQMEGEVCSQRNAFRETEAAFARTEVEHERRLSEREQQCLALLSHKGEELSRKEEELSCARKFCGEVRQALAMTGTKTNAMMSEREQELQNRQMLLSQKHEEVCHERDGHKAAESALAKLRTEFEEALARQDQQYQKLLSEKSDELYREQKDRQEGLQTRNESLAAKIKKLNREMKADQRCNDAARSELDMKNSMLEDENKQLMQELQGLESRLAMQDPEQQLPNQLPTPPAVHSMSAYDEQADHVMATESDDDNDQSYMLEFPNASEANVPVLEAETTASFAVAYKNKGSSFRPSRSTKKDNQKDLLKAVQNGGGVSRKTKPTHNAVEKMVKLDTAVRKPAREHTSKEARQAKTAEIISKKVPSADD